MASAEKTWKSLMPRVRADVVNLFEKMMHTDLTNPRGDGIRWTALFNGLRALNQYGVERMWTARANREWRVFIERDAGVYRVFDIIHRNDNRFYSSEA